MCLLFIRAFKPHVLEFYVHFGVNRLLSAFHDKTKTTHQSNGAISCQVIYSVTEMQYSVNCLLLIFLKEKSKYFSFDVIPQKY